MQVQVKHNGTDITGFVIEYERVHKICTGIGTLDIEIVDTITRTFKPWDSIDIYENGDFKVRYYISSIEHNIPRGSLQLGCQDNSKRIVDYFIPDSYTVDYPSYNKYWIDKFLTEAGVDIIWNTSSPGTLLSNFTQLGLTTVYEQIQTLLQMSGWYMYFDGNGKAVIGALDVEFADSVASVGKTDILNILVTSNDKMLRNKALVFGSYDGYSGQNAKASVTVHTPWNYDHNDLRTVVISNSNIKDDGTAYLMANQIIKEFARITIEKHITVWGARNFNLGTALRVTSNVWRGRGLVTTFGTSMSKQGLVTNVVLDERCPRLFGFFDFGDYVYVAFFGDGVWRKHIKYDPTWYNFSTGLTDLNITDMYINQGVFGSVGSSGQQFYAIDNLPWHQIPLESLVSSIEDNVDVTLSGEIPSQAFSGLMARGVTIDKNLFTVKYVVDNASGINYGDYFLDHSITTVSGVTGSGVASSGAGSDFAGKRGWIVEYDVLSGDLTGTPYPISLSGCYAYTVLDIDNDGVNDYVSVATSGVLSFPKTALGYNFGRKTSQISYDTYDSQNTPAYNLYDDFNESGESLGGLASTGTAGVAVFNDESSGERELVWTESVSSIFKFKRIQITKPAGTITATTKTSPNLTTTYPYIQKAGTDLYRGYRVNITIPGAGVTRKYEAFYITWNAADNTISSETSLGYIEIPTTTTANNEHVDVYMSMINNKIYCTAMNFCYFDGTAAKYENYISFYMLVVDTIANTASGGFVNRIDFETAESPVFGKKWNIFSLTGALPLPRWGYQNGDFPAYAFYVREWNQLAVGSATVLRNWLVYSQSGGTFQKVKIQETTTSSDTNFMTGSNSATTTGCQLTNDRYILYAKLSTRNFAYVYNGLSVSIPSLTSIPFSWNPANITPIFGQHDDFYVANNSGTYYQCDPAGFTATSVITFPTGYTPVKIFSTSDYLNTLYYWQLQNNDTLANEIFRYSSTGYYGTKITPAASFSFSRPRGFIAGNFFIDFGNIPGAASSTNLRWLYIDNQDIGTASTIFQILRRDPDKFTLIQQENYALRLDISGTSPVVTVGSGESTFQSNYVYETELVTVQAVPSGTVIASGGNQVNDYRYTMIQPTLGLLTSGLGISSTILYAHASGIFAADALSYSGGFTQMFSIPSGEALRIETSNYGIGGQYIFVSASGYTQTFFQQDPATYTFYEHATNYPQTRATIIRLDDAL